MTESVEYRQEEVKAAWKDFISGKMPKSGVHPRVLNSWERCEKKNVDPLLLSAPVPYNNEKLTELKNQNRRLVEVSQPIIEHLYQFIKGSGFTVSISDRKGILLLVYGDDDAVGQARQGNGIPGADWSEEGSGNNPIGTAIVENRPLQIVGYEHYCRNPHNWSGSGAPIHDPSGKIIGAMSICGDKEIVHYHTLGMVVMTTYTIEKQMEILETLAKLNHEYDYKSVLVNSISDGVLVINQDNVITDINQAICKILGTLENYLLDKPIDFFTKDKILLDAIYGKTILRDYVTDIYINNKKVPCTVTVQPIKAAEEYKTILVISDVRRIKKLVKKIDANSAAYTFEKIVGRNVQFLRSIEMAKTIARTDSSVLLLGESGTGKELFAQAIHNHSKRRNGPFVAINCGAMPQNLIISELFGYVEGAFTGARKGGQIGRFELANGGTMFLDEIGELPLELQATILRAIEQLVITRVGDQISTPIDIRIISATNRNLLEEIKKVNFRQDLYYRLNVLSVEIMPLRERKDDIEELTLSFIKTLNDKYSKNVISATDEVWQLFGDYDWPGNIRELKNVVERAVVLTKAPFITVDDLPREMIRHHLSSNDKSQELPLQVSYNSDEAVLRSLLERNRWNVSRVAKELGVARTTVYRRMDRYGIAK